MPFGICSAPEIFRQRMHELIEGLQGVEVVADNFVVVGQGDTIEDASRDHDNNLTLYWTDVRQAKFRKSQAEDDRGTYHWPHGY